MGQQPFVEMGGDRRRFRRVRHDAHASRFTGSAGGQDHHRRKLGKQLRPRALLRRHRGRLGGRHERPVRQQHHHFRRHSGGSEHGRRVGARCGKTVIQVSAGFWLCCPGLVLRRHRGRCGSQQPRPARHHPPPDSTIDLPVAANNGAGSALFGKTVVAISAGQQSALALCSDGTVVAWGYNGDGELGNNSTTGSGVRWRAVDATADSALFREKPSS